MAAAPIKVFGTPMSTATARVLACLVENQLPFEFIPIDMSKGQHKKPEFLAIQPFGQVPAFQDEHITLFESRAICRYIVDKYTEKGKRGLLGSSECWLERASIEQWMEAESQNFNPPSSALVFQLAFAPLMKLNQDPNLIAQSETKLGKVLDVYEQRLEGSRYLAGDHFSLADLSHLPNAHFLVNVTDRASLFTSRKNVSRWWEEISGRESWKRVAEMQKPKPSSSSS